MRIVRLSPTLADSPVIKRRNRKKDGQNLDRNNILPEGLKRTRTQTVPFHAQPSRHQKTRVYYKNEGWNNALPTTELNKIRDLSLKNLGINSLKGMPELPNLETLDLSGNNLDNLKEALDIIDMNCPNLESLNLSYNSFGKGQ
uniref:Uncharacterized protein n=1 Tax=Ditylenchus dipsaci TaxID=166011 RepID=A0A915DM03_9BILA